MAIDFPNSPTNGQVFTVGEVTWVYDGSKWNLNSTTTAFAPIGTIIAYGGSIPPNGWLQANGTSLSRSIYADLFSIIGTTFGPGSVPGTTFALPNFSSSEGMYIIRATDADPVIISESRISVPVGTLQLFAAAPTGGGWLRANGATISRTSYANLFSAIGTTYGSGDGSTTFTIPNISDSGSGSPAYYIKAIISGDLEPSTVAHAASHTEGGTDVVTVTGNQIANYQTYRNVVINGAMSVAQRNTSVAGITGTAYNTADRWRTNINSLGTWTNSVENDGPTDSGLRKSLKMLCTTADSSPAASDYAAMIYHFEGQNLQHFAKGTSSAKKFALSFWVKSNVTGAYIVELEDNDNTRRICSAYTVNASGVWEKKTIVFSGDTTGAFDNDANGSLTMLFWLAAGSNFTTGTLGTIWGANTNSTRAVGQVNLAASTNNYWQVTGVQLEAGDVATPFEFEPFETTLRKCQRYYEKSYNVATVPGTNTGAGVAFYWGGTQNDGIVGGYVSFKTPKRAAPSTITPYTQGGTANQWDVFRAGANSVVATTILGQGENGFNAYGNTGAANTVARIAGHWIADAEI